MIAGGLTRSARLVVLSPGGGRGAHAMLLSRRAVLLALAAPAEGRRRPHFPPAGMGPAPACPPRAERLAWARAAERLAATAAKAELAGGLYAALARGDLDAAGEAVRGAGAVGLDPRAFEADVRLALLLDGCFDV
jgi:hypothetical protein